MSALIRDPEPPERLDQKASPEPTEVARPAGGIREVDIDLIDPNPHQPRTRFREESLEELAQSIRATGVIQPIVARPIGPRFQLIAGERRWRAAQRAGLHRIPTIVREVSDHVALEMTVVENLQREDLNPVEQARAFDTLITTFGLTQEDAATRTGKDRATIANSVRLLKLDQPILALLEDGKLSAGHGRALLAFNNSAARLAAARRAADGKLTVRALERLASRSQRSASSKEPEAPEIVDPNTRAALEDLQRELGTRVTLHPPQGRRPGQLVIEYHEDRQLYALYERIKRTKDY
ncbi:MAG TPA: ParB/RepB/Spo0J family partition protein [Candidatus Acidoferrales bacterium]|nr:ParB/RepB/Spo0J family partition protein [Candidatus Acidoferrales bacterium]